MMMLMMMMMMMVMMMMMMMIAAVSGRLTTYPRPPYNLKTQTLQKIKAAEYMFRSQNKCPTHLLTPNVARKYLGLGHQNPFQQCINQSRLP